MGGLIGINGTWLKGKYLAESWDETTTGIYTMTHLITGGIQPNIYNYGTLIVFRSTYAASAQLYISDRGEIAVRCSINENGPTWRDWKICKTE